jgi:putative SOS response-associated peptidase YedK
VATKPAFRSAIKTRRCIVPATGYFEWKKLPDGTKQPYYFSRRDGEPLAFAAIWEGETVATITTEPNREAAQVHDRMPVILDSGQYDRWMKAVPLSEEERRVFLRPLRDGSLGSYPVDRRVGSVRYDDPALISPG